MSPIATGDVQIANVAWELEGCFAERTSTNRFLRRSHLCHQLYLHIFLVSKIRFIWLPNIFPFAPLIFFSHHQNLLTWTYYSQYIDNFYNFAYNKFYLTFYIGCLLIWRYCSVKSLVDIVYWTSVYICDESICKLSKLLQSTYFRRKQTSQIWSDNYYI